jgi:ATP-dependent DNA helicase RecQ
MQVDVLTLRYDPSRGVLDDTALRDFVRDKVVLAVRDHFYQVGNTPHLTLVIEYRLPAPGPGARPEPAGRRDGAVATRDLRETLPQGERELFDLLRAWRARLAREEGVPAYAILTNAELVAIARERPASPRALVAIPGIGRRRAERHGRELLTIIGQASPPAAAGEAAPPVDGGDAAGEAD